MSKRLYLTTPLYYVNARPHIGHAYTTILADSIARAHRQRGEEVFLLTGTDEHGEKIAQAADAEKLSPQAFADKNSAMFKALWKSWGVSYDRFIRTTDPDHVQAVQKVLEALKSKGALVPGTYTFWYCVPCETSWALSDLADPAKELCPTCQRPIEEVTEQDYFLNLEDHRGWLKDHILSHPEFIRPESRRNEVLSLLGKPLPALCVTRPKARVSWGIPVPFSPTHVTYVWFDALLNYISALGWPDSERFHSLWEEAGAIHLIGKDILRHHALYWPIILHALGVAPPKTVFAHGWWLIKGEKMSKSKGNIVDPEAVVSTYGLDALRYFLLRDVPLGEDGIFSEEALVKRINADLANDLGNLVYRTLTMLEKHVGGKVPPGRVLPEWRQLAETAGAGVEAGVLRIAPDQSLKSLWEFIGRANRSVEEKAPWTLAREGRRAELEAFLYQLAENLRVTALLIWPFLPDTGRSIWEQLGFKDPIDRQRIPSAFDVPISSGQTVAKGKPLFPRLLSEE